MFAENDYLTRARDLTDGVRWHKSNPTDCLLAAATCALIDIAESLRATRPQLVKLTLCPECNAAKADQ